MNKSEKYRFKAYDPAITARFSKERARILVALPHARVEHTGSTAVPGLGGKGILDITVFIKKTELATAKRRLSERYEFRPRASAPERLFFRKDFIMGGKRNRTHIHLVHTRGEFRKMIAFRDYLRAHPTDAQEYATVKRRAARAAKGDMTIYKAIKKPFIDGIMAKCR